MVYRRDVLPLSETFILAQIRALRRYRPHLFGLRLAQGLDLGGLPVHTLGAARLGRMREIIFRYAGCSPSLLEAARECRPALIHAHFAMDGADCLPIVESLNIPLVVTLHGWDVTVSDRTFKRTLSGRRFLSLRRRLQQRASVFLCVSKFIQQQALKKGFPAEKLLVHYTGVDTAALAPPPPPAPAGFAENDDALLSPCAPEKIVLFVGRLVEKKGLSFLLRAMAGSGLAGAPVRLVVIGDGPVRRRRESEAARCGVRCEFLGVRPNSTVHDWMRRAYVLAVPSVQAKSGDREGLPTVVLEAFALGLPVVAFASAGIPEAVSSNCGLLAPEGDFERLGVQLRLMLENEDLRNRLAAGARQCAVQNFDLAAQTERLEQIYDRVVSGAGIAGAAHGLRLVHAQ
jgi:glycosyltransferase involved in cell wall biosynthesis